MEIKGGKLSASEIVHIAVRPYVLAFGLRSPIAWQLSDVGLDTQLIVNDVLAAFAREGYELRNVHQRVLPPPPIEWETKAPEPTSLWRAAWNVVRFVATREWASVSARLVWIATCEVCDITSEFDGSLSVEELGEAALPGYGGMFCARCAHAVKVLSRGVS